MLLSELPHELMLEIWHCLFDNIRNTALGANASLRQSWLLNVLSTCMVCRSWCNAGMEYLSIRFSSSSSLSLISALESIECPVTGAPIMKLGWSRLLLESKQNQLVFHKYVRKVVLNLSGVFSPSVPQHGIMQNGSTSTLKHIVDIEYFSESIKLILTSCPNIKTVEILYDMHYTSLTGNHWPCQLWDLLSNSISDALTLHRSQHHHNPMVPAAKSSLSIPSTCSFLSHLVLTSREPIQRCPCCAGHGWDHTIQPLLQQLPVTTLELDRILPSRSLLECLAETRKIHTLVIRGDVLIQASRLARYGASISTPPRIPLHLLSQIRTLEIYLQSNHEEQDGDNDQSALDLLAVFRQIYDIIHPIKSLQRLVLHGRKQFNIPFNATAATAVTMDGSSLVNNDVWNKLKLLADRHQLKSFVLENIPGFRCPSVQSRLQNMFISVEKVNVVYST